MLPGADTKAAAAAAAANAGPNAATASGIAARFKNKIQCESLW